MYRKFKPLNIPDGWEQYWSKYPNGYTIMEALIDWVSQVDDMVYNQNELSDKVKSFGVIIDEFLNQFDTELQKEVQDLLTDWQNSGFLNVVISEALQWQLDDYITTNEQDKVTLGEQLQQSDKYRDDIMINVLAHGVVGDGVTDTTTAIQTLINNTPNGKIIYFPRGQYKITEPIIIPRDLTLLGTDATYSGGAILRFELNATHLKGVGCIQIASGVRDIRLKNLYIRDYKSATHYYDGISNIGNTGYNVGLEFDNVQLVGFRYGFNLTHLYLTKFVSCQTTQCDIGFNIDGFSTTLMFEQCYAVQCALTGYSIAGAVYSTMIGCVAEQCEQFGYNIVRAENISLFGCGSESINITAIRIDRSTCVTVDNFYGLLNGSTDSPYGTMVQINVEATYISLNNITEMELSPNHNRQFAISANTDAHGVIDNVRTLLPVSVGNNIRYNGQYLFNRMPTNGGHFIGKVVYNSAMTTGSPIGWICVSANPFVWQPLANME